MTEHLIDQQRYRTILFAAPLEATRIEDWVGATPKAARIRHIEAREFRMAAATGHVAFVRAFEIRGLLLDGLRTSLIQLGMVWASSPPMSEDDWRIRAMGRLVRGVGESPQTILQLSQTAVWPSSPWRWAVSAPRGTDQPIPLDSLHVIPTMYLGDHEPYASAPAAFDALMNHVVVGWSKGRPWDSVWRTTDG